MVLTKEEIQELKDTALSMADEGKVWDEIQRMLYDCIKPNCDSDHDAIARIKKACEKRVVDTTPKKATPSLPTSDAESSTPSSPVLPSEELPLYQKRNVEKTKKLARHTLEGKVAIKMCKEMVAHLAERGMKPESIRCIINDWMQTVGKNYIPDDDEREGVEKEVGFVIHNYEQYYHDLNFEKEFAGFDRKEIHAKAVDILEHGDPLKVAIDAFHTMAAGNEEVCIMMILLFCGASCGNTKGIILFINGKAGIGKSYEARASMKLLPWECTTVASVSDKALLYHEYSAGMMFLMDDAEIPQDLERIMKESSGAYQEETTFKTVNKGTPITLTIPPRTTYATTSVENANGVQMNSRGFPITIEESEERDAAVEKIWEEIERTGDEGFKISEEVLICREMLREIRKKLHYVKLSAEVIDAFKARIPKRDYRARNILTDMTKDFAILRHRQREVDKRGKIIATIDDFNDAMELYEPRETTIRSKLTENEMMVLRYIMENRRVTFEQIQDGTNLSKGQLNYTINGKGKNHDSGLAHKIPRFKAEKVTEEVITDKGKENRQKTFYSIVEDSRKR